MILQCPSCFAKYFIDNGAVKGTLHRKLRCSKCSYQWTQSSHKENSAVIKNKEKVGSVRNNNQLAQDSRINYAILFNLFVVLSMFVLFVLFFYDSLPVAMRSNIYNALPFKVSNIIDTGNMFFDKLSIENSQYKSQYNIALKGFIVNNSNKVKVVPPIRICLDNAVNKCIKSYYIRSNGKVIEPNTREYFYYRIIDVDHEVDRVVVDMGNKIELMLR